MVTDFDTFLSQLLGRQAIPSPQPSLLPAIRQDAPAPSEGPPMPQGYTPPPPQPAQPMSPIVVAPPQPQPTPAPQAPAPSPAPAQPGSVRTSTSYQLVLYQSPQGEVRIMVPVERTKNLPETARKVGDPISDPSRLDEAERGGFLWEQLPPEYQAQFRTSEEVFDVSQERNEQQQVAPDVVNPETGQVLRPGDEYPVDPNEPRPRGEALLAQTPETTTAQLRQSGDPNAAAMADMLESHGITVIPAGMTPVMGQDGAIVMRPITEVVAQEQGVMQGPAVPEGTTPTGTQPVQPTEGPALATGQPGVAQRQQPAFDASGMPVLTTQALRTYDPAKAAELEANGIFTIGGDEVVIRQNGVPVLMQRSQMPENAEVITYGGASEPTPEKGNIFEDVGDAITAPVEVAVDLVTQGPGAAWNEVQEGWEGLASTGRGVFGFTTQGLDYLLENVGKPVGGWTASTAADAISSFDDAWDVLWDELPEPVRQIVGAMAQPAGTALTPFLGMGDDVVGVVGNLVPWVGVVEWGMESPDLVRQVEEHGWDADGDGVADYTGARAVWEAFQNDQSVAGRAWNDIWFDPLNLATAGGAALIRGGTRILGTEATQQGWRWLVGGGMRELGRVLQLPDAAMDGLILGTLKRLFRPLGRQAQRVPVVRWLADLSPRALVERASEQIGEPVMDIFRRTAYGEASLAPEGPGPMQGPPVPRMPPGPSSSGTQGPPPGQQVPGPGTMVGRSPAREATEVTGGVPRGAQATPGGGTIEQTPFRAQENAPPVSRQQVFGREARAETPPQQVLQPQLVPGPAQQVVPPAPPAQAVPAPQPAPSEPFAGTTLAEPAAVGPREPISAPVEKPEWDYLTPRSADERPEGDLPRIIDAVWDAREQYPERWAAFQQEYAPKAETRLQQRRQTRTGSGGIPISERAADAINTAQHVIYDLMPAVQRHYGDVMNVPAYRFENAGNRPEQMAFKVEHAIFEEDEALAQEYMAALRGERYVRRGSDGDIHFNERKTPNAERLTPDKMQQVQQLRQRYQAMRGQQSQQRVPQAPTAPSAQVSQTPTAPQATVPQEAAEAATETEVRRVPVSRIRSTFGMTDQELADAGVRRYQMRDEPFSEATAADVAERYNPLSYNANPISVTQGTDGNYYVLSGHSRFEGFRRSGRDDMDVIVHRGDPDALEQFALNSNTDAAALTPFEQARVIQRRVERGETIEEIADSMKAGSATGKRGTNQVRNLYYLNFLPESSALRKAVAEGTVEVNRGARLGEAIGRGIITPAEADATFRELTTGDMTLTDVNRAINRHAQKVGDGSASQMKLISDRDAGGTGFAETVRELRDLKTERNTLVADRQAINRRARAVGADVSDDDRTALSRIQERIEAIDAELEELEQSRFVEPMRLPDTQSQMDVGAAGRPDMTAMRAREGGEATARDVLNQPEQTPADQMRASGANALFFSANEQARANAQRMATATQDALTAERSNPIFAEQQAADALRQADTFTSDAPVIDRDRYRGRVLGRQERDVLEMRFDTNADGTVATRPASLEGSGTVFDRSATSRVEGEETDGLGETVRDRLDRYIREAEGDQAFMEQVRTDLMDGKDPLFENQKLRGDELQAAIVGKVEEYAAERVINDWAVQALQKRGGKAYQKYQKELDRLMQADPKLPESAAAVNALGKSIRPDQIPVYDAALAALREMALYNTLSGPRYILTQVVGNAITALLTGNARIVWQALTPNELRSAYRELGNYPDGVLSAHDSNAYTALGLQRPSPAAVVKDEVTQRGRDLHMHTATDRMFPWKRDKLPSGEAHKGFRFSSIFANKHVRDWANAVDLSYRHALAEQQIRGNMALANRDFFQHALDRAPQGVDEARLQQAFDDLASNDAGAGLYSSDDVRRVFRQMGHATYADRMARDWQSAISRARRSAQDEVNRVFFSGDELNADRIARRIVFFHYWMSRAAPLYTASIMKHAGMTNAYANMMAEMEESAEEFGPAAEGFVKFFSTPMGYNIFIRPDAMFQVFASFWSDAGYAPDGENWLGKFMRQAGTMFNPIIATVVNLSGSMGDTFAPDPLMLGQWTRLVQEGINYGRSQGWLSGDTPAGNVYNDIMSWVRSYTSDVAEEVIPGVEQIPYRDSAVFSHRELNYLIMDVAEEQGYERDGIEAMTALNNPDSPLYQEAFRRMADQGMLEAGLRYIPFFGTPVLFPKGRVASQDELNRQIAALPEGSEEQMRLIRQRAAANTVNPDVTRLRNETSAYYELGDPETREAYTTYNRIRFGEATEDVTVGGETATAAQINAAPEELRGQWADAWAAENGYTEQFDQLREQRSSFIEGSQSFGTYRTWQDTVRDHPQGIIGWWRQTARDNPNAARFFEEYQQNYTGPIRDFEDGLLSQRAYAAVVGDQYTYRDASPISTNSGNAPFMASAPPSSGFPSGSGQAIQPSLPEQMRTYETERAEYNRLLSQMWGQELDIDNLNPIDRAAAREQMVLQHGIEPPSMPGDVRQYLEWAAAQQPGTDTSVAAFLAWRERTAPVGSR